MVPRLPEMIEEGRSLRDAHKHRTRHALREAALRLFAARGFDATKTEEIAEKAGVSARTFFRYFPTKESVLFLGERTWAQSFAEIYQRQPEATSDVDALRSTLVELASDLPRSRQGLRMYEKIVASSPTLRGREQDHQEENTAKVAKTIAARRGRTRADETINILAAVVVLVYRRALDAWLTKPSNAQLSEVIEKEFYLLTEAFIQSRPRGTVNWRGNGHARGRSPR